MSSAKAKVFLFTRVLFCFLSTPTTSPSLMAQCQTVPLRRMLYILYTCLCCIVSKGSGTNNRRWQKMSSAIWLSYHITVLTAWMLFSSVDFWSQLAQANQLQALWVRGYQMPVSMETILKEKNLVNCWWCLTVRLLVLTSLVCRSCLEAAWQYDYLE